MPKQTLYIRKSDYPKWTSLKKKSELVSFALSLEDWEIEAIKKAREQRDQAIKLPSGN